MPSWKPAQSFRGHRILHERHQDIPWSLRSIRRYITLEGALSSLLEQDFHRKSLTTWDSCFTSETAAKKKVPVSAGDPVCHVLKQPGKGLFFPVEIIYTRFFSVIATGNSAHYRAFTAAVFGGNSLPKLGNLTSQGEDDRALCTKPAIFQGVKKF